MDRAAQPMRIYNCPTTPEISVTSLWLAWTEQRNQWVILIELIQPEAPGLVQHPKKPDDLLPSRPDKLHTKRQQVHISMFRNLLQLTNSVVIGF
jgi:hypothetical protein